MTPAEHQGLDRIADAFDRLTEAIKLKVRQNNRLIGLLAVVFFIQIVLFLGQLRVNRSVLDQSLKNQDHIDCVVAVLTRQDPPKCRGVREQLARDGIAVPSTTTTSTIPRSEPS